MHGSALVEAKHNPPTLPRITETAFCGFLLHDAVSILVESLFKQVVLQLGLLLFAWSRHILLLFLFFGRNAIYKK